MTKLKQFISILLLSICSLLYKHTDIDIIYDNEYSKIIKIEFWGK